MCFRVADFMCMVSQNQYVLRMRVRSTAVLCQQLWQHTCGRPSQISSIKQGQLRDSITAGRYLNLALRAEQSTDDIIDASMLINIS